MWSDRILDEMARNLVKDEKVEQGKADKLVDVMQRAFPEAAQDADAISALEADMPNAEGDRHVLATAVVAGAEGIVTFNLKDFKDDDLNPLGKQAIPPDEFLCTLHEMHPDSVERVLEEQAAALKNPPKSVDDILELLERGGVPTFVARIQNARSST